MRKVTNPFDCRAFGKAVKDARIKSGLTRAEVEGKDNIDARYLLAIENAGQHMSLQIFYELATIFSISVDQFFFPECSATTFLINWDNENDKKLADS